MNMNIVNENPVEMLRIRHKMTQKEFATKLGYTNVNTYAYHAKVYSEDIRNRVSEVFSIDLTAAIITYLLQQIKSLSPVKEKKVAKALGNKTSDPSQLSNLLSSLNS